MAAGTIDPMHQFQIDPLLGGWNPAGTPFAITNSTLWMAIVLIALWVFMLGGMKRQLIPGRWQAAVEGFTSFVDNMIDTSIGPNGRKFTPYIFTLFSFILFANVLGLLPLSIVPGLHAFTVTSQFSVTGILAILSFSIVLVVAFWKHGFRFFGLFVPHGTPAPMIPLIFMVELISFMVRPFSLGLRLFIAMIAGHILMDVFGSFIITGLHAGVGNSLIVSLPSFLLIAGIGALEILIAAIQAYVFALLTSLYLNDAINMHSAH